MIRLVSKLLPLVFFVGCSASNFGLNKDGVFNIPQVGTFRSNQVGLLLSLVPRASSGPRPDWELISLSNRRLVYAINVEDEVWFANELGLFLRFNGWDFTEVKGLKEGAELVEIKLKSDKKIYDINEANQYEFTCSGWKKIILTSNNVIKYEENCKSLEKEFTNHIVVDSMGAIIEFRFVLHPEEEPFFLKLI